MTEPSNHAGLRGGEYRGQTGDKTGTRRGQRENLLHDEIYSFIYMFLAPVVCLFLLLLVPWRWLVGRLCTVLEMSARGAFPGAHPRPGCMAWPLALLVCHRLSLRLVRVIAWWVNSSTSEWVNHCLDARHDDVFVWRGSPMAVAVLSCLSWAPVPCPWPCLCLCPWPWSSVVACPCWCWCWCWRVVHGRAAVSELAPVPCPWASVAAVACLWLCMLPVLGAHACARGCAGC